MSAENTPAQRLQERLSFAVNERRTIRIIAYGVLVDEWLMARYHK